MERQLIASVFDYKSYKKTIKWFEENNIDILNCVFNKSWDQYDIYLALNLEQTLKVKEYLRPIGYLWSPNKEGKKIEA